MSFPKVVLACGCHGSSSVFNRFQVTNWKLKYLICSILPSAPSKGSTRKVIVYNEGLMCCTGNTWNTSLSSLRILSSRSLYLVLALHFNSLSLVRNHLEWFGDSSINLWGWLFLSIHLDLLWCSVSFICMLLAHCEWIWFSMFFLSDNQSK